MSHFAGGGMNPKVDTVSYFGTSLSWLLLVMTTIAAASGVSAQELPFFVDTVDVEVVNIDVVVTDRKGNMVTDLSRDDFTLLVDGEPVELSNFFAVSEGRPTTPSGVDLQREATAAKPESLPESQQLNMVVFIDDSNIQRFGRKAAFAALREFLEQRADAGQRIMLVRYADGLKVFTELTDSPEQAIAAIDQIESSVAPGSQQFSEWARIVRDYENKASADIEAAINFYAESLRHDCRVKIALMKSFIGALAGLEGRKAIVYVSDGMPIHPGESLFAMIFDPVRAKLESNRYSIQRDLRSLSDHANASRVTFYTLNSGGWLADDLRSRMTSVAATPVVTIEASYTADWNHTESLVAMAHDTGGQALRKASPAAFERVANDLDSYYSLGFVSPDPGTPVTGKVKIKVNRKGLDLRYRRSFRSIPHEEQLANAAVAALINESEENRLQVSLDIGDSGKKHKRKSFLVPMTVRIPSKKLAFVQDGESWHASVVIHITGQDERGDLVDPIKESLPISIPDHVYTAGGVPEILYDLELRVRKGTLKIALSVHDELGGVTTALVSRINVSDEGAVTVVDNSEESDRGGNLA
jgi:VWFA-related protein